MQLVIEIPDRFVKDRDGIFIDDVYKATPEVMDAFFESILKGAPLPKYHGRLIDADKTISKICGSSCGCHLEECGHDEPCFSVVRIKSAQTIIPATKEGVE